jgi:hypothetical protein
VAAYCRGAPGPGSLHEGLDFLQSETGSFVSWTPSPAKTGMPARYSAIFDTAGKSAAGAPEERERPGNVYHVQPNTFRHDLGNFGKPKFAGHTVVSGVHV